MKDMKKEREQLVGDLERLGVFKTPDVKEAMLKVRRELFVAVGYRVDAYVDVALPIPGGATISQPLIYATILEAIKLKKGENVLEVGSGSGYGSALMYEIVGSSGKVTTIEIVPEVCKFAKSNLKKTGYDMVKVICGDGSEGYKEFAPYDAVVVTAACPEVPKPLIDQLKYGGRLVAPVGGESGGQALVYLEKQIDGKIIRKNLGGVIFLPLRGRHGYKI